MRMGIILGVWRSADKKWVDLYPNMPTPRLCSSVVTYNEWLIVAGGYNLYSVDVMNIDTKEWYSGPPAPTCFSSMKTATVGDMCYYMGGYADGCAIKDVYRVSLPALISQVKSRNIDPQIWKKISPLNVAFSTPLSIGGCLLALGGRSLSTSIQHYRPESDDWIQVGDLPSPLSEYTCAVDGDVLVADNARLSSASFM